MEPMKKNIIAMAVAAAVAAPAAAMADTTLYGKIHMSYDFYTGDNNDASDYGLSSNSSRLGIKGTEAISDNLSLVYQYEVSVEPTDSRANGKDLFGSARNSFIGFTGSWGTAIAGIHDTPFKLVGRKYDLFGDTIGDSRSLISSKDEILTTGKSSPGFDLRTDNTVAYITPDMGGFSAVLAYVSDHGYGDVTGEPYQDSAIDNNDFDAYSLSAGYEIAGFTIDAAYEQHNIADIAGLADSENAWRVGAGYKMGGFKVVGLWQQTDDAGFVSGNERTTYGLGGAYSFGKSTIKAQWYTADELDTDAGSADDGADLWAVGYDYKLSKQTSVYAVYAATDNDTNGDYTISGGGHGDGYPKDSTFAGGESGAFSLGVVHKF
jgi:predicted porin